LKADERIVLVGLNTKQLGQLPKNIIGLERTESKEELIALYAHASVFMNLTYADTYPTTNLESLSCGTPVITYNTGGSPEEIRDFNGKVVPQGDYSAAYLAFSSMRNGFKQQNTETIRKDAVSRLDKSFQLKKYGELYQSLLIDR
ncbi:MAG: glycosyltransferase, partial [Maribacter sp.]